MIAGRMNPLLVGLVEFTTVHRIQDIPAALVVERQRTESRSVNRDQLPTKLKLAVDRGEELWRALQTERANCENSLIADCVTTLFAAASPFKLRSAPSQIVES